MERGTVNLNCLIGYEARPAGHVSYADVSVPLLSITEYSLIDRLSD